MSIENENWDWERDVLKGCDEIFDINVSVLRSHQSHQKPSNYSKMSKIKKLEKFENKKTFKIWRGFCLHSLRELRIKTNQLISGLSWPAQPINSRQNNKKSRQILKNLKLVWSFQVHSSSLDRVYQCPQCEKGFKEHRTLKLHLKIHNAEYPEQCSVCQKVFRTKWQLKQHQMDHGGERPYPCPECSFTCKTKQQLNEHRRKHSVSF